MKVSANTTIDASPKKVWQAVTDIENVAKLMPAIKKIEVLESPKSGLVGLKWRETRVMFGKEASETMWITDVEDGNSYLTRAESHGSIYKSGVYVEGIDGKTRLEQTFEAQPVSLYAKITNFLFARMMKNGIEKDLTDIKQYLES